MDQIVSEYETRGAKTTATLKLQKAKELQAAAQVSLDQLRSRRGAMKNTDINISAVDAQIVVAATKLAATIQNVAMVQSDCDKIGCDAASVTGKLVVANNPTTQKQSDSNVLADQNDSLPVWAYVLIALALLGIVLGIAWFFTRSPSSLSPSPSTLLPSTRSTPLPSTLSEPISSVSTISEPTPPPSILSPPTPPPSTLIPPPPPPSTLIPPPPLISSTTNPTAVIVPPQPTVDVPPTTNLVSQPPPKIESQPATQIVPETKQPATQPISETKTIAETKQPATQPISETKTIAPTSQTIAETKEPATLPTLQTPTITQPPANTTQK